jgi:multiple sugar transport system substrate-binding protein
MMCSRTESRDAATLAGRVGWLSLAAVAGLSAAGLWSSEPARAQDAAPITIVINQSPWYEGFRGLVEYYEEQTGNQVELDVNPFAGSIEKQRSSARAPEGTIDLFTMNSPILPEMYSSGLLHSMDELDPDFALEAGVDTFDDTACWDAEKSSFDCATGKLMGVPINPNIQMLYYRADLYEENGLEVPQTWDELLANAKALHNPTEVFGIVQRGGRATSAVSYNVMPYLWSFGASIFADMDSGDYTVTLNSPEGLDALQFYIDLAKEAGHPNTGSITQSDMLQLAATGRAAHFIGVIAAWNQLDDPNKSAVVGQFNVAVIPKAPGHEPATTLGHFISGIPKNIPDERKEAAITFLKWFQTYDAQKKYAEVGGVPVRSDVLEDEELASQEKFRWMRPLAENFAYARVWWDVPEGSELTAILELRVNQAITGELSPAAALNLAAEEMHAIMSQAGYKTGQLEDLPE